MGPSLPFRRSWVVSSQTCTALYSAEDSRGPFAISGAPPTPTSLSLHIYLFQQSALRRLAAWSPSNPNSIFSTQPGSAWVPLPVCCPGNSFCSVSGGDSIIYLIYFTLPGSLTWSADSQHLKMFVSYNLSTSFSCFGRRGNAVLIVPAWLKEVFLISF